MTDPTLVLRLSRRRTIVEQTDPEVVFDLLFIDRQGNFEERASVYLIPGRQEKLVQIAAEHSANRELDPEVRVGVDLAGLFTVDCLPDDDLGHFKFRRDVHHELHFGTDQTEARAIALQLATTNGMLGAPPTGRAWLCEKLVLREYARERTKAKDPEWVTACACSLKVSGWAIKKDPSVSAA